VYCAPTRLSAGLLRPAMSQSGRVGFSPSGLMTVGFSKLVFATGATGTFVTVCDIFSGIQEDYHVSPGSKFVGLKLRVNLPFSIPGCDLLKRLKWAWLSGRMFTVVPSLSQSGECHAAPKLRSFLMPMGERSLESTMYTCNCELYRLGVPDGNELVGV
jgi:hypothetical protein